MGLQETLCHTRFQSMMLFVFKDICTSWFFGNLIHVHHDKQNCIWMSLTGAVEMKCKGDMFYHLSGHLDVPDRVLCWENMHCSVTAAVHMQESCICNVLFIDLTSGKDKKYVNWEAQVYHFPCCIGLYTSSTISHCKLQIYCQDKPQYKNARMLLQ